MLPRYRSVLLDLRWSCLRWLLLALVGPDGRSLKDVEMEHIMSVLNKHQGNKPAAAAELGISLKTLYNRLNAWQDEKRVAG